MSNPQLESIRIAKPCSANWDDMTGDDRVRFCGLCEKNVYDISQMTRKDAELLVLHTEKIPCVRLFRRADGRVLTSDCQEGLRRRFLKAAGFALSFAWGWGRVALAQGERTGTIRVEAVDPKGLPIDFASVTYLAIDSQAPPTRMSTAKNGVFVAEAVEPGSYRIEAKNSGFLTSTQTVQVVPGTTTTVTMQLRIGAVTMGGPITSGRWQKKVKRPKKS